MHSYPTSPDSEVKELRRTTVAADEVAAAEGARINIYGISDLDDCQYTTFASRIIVSVAQKFAIRIIVPVAPYVLYNRFPCCLDIRADHHLSNRSCRSLRR